MANVDDEYRRLVEHVFNHGSYRTDRTGTGTRSVFGYQMRLNLADGFPILTTKHVHFKSVVHELLWFIRGDTNVKYLNENGVTIWDEWTDKNGDLGPVYGRQWRSWYAGERTVDTGIGETSEPILIDQLSQVIDDIRRDPSSRRLVVSAWNVADIPAMALPPCHLLFQFYVNAGRLSCQVYQRSADVGLGVPFNIASYALLTHLVASVSGLDVGELIWTGGDVHIYLPHTQALQEQISRKPYGHAVLDVNAARRNIDDFVYEDILLSNYFHHPAVKLEVAV